MAYTTAMPTTVATTWNLMTTSCTQERRRVLCGPKSMKLKGSIAAGIFAGSSSVFVRDGLSLNVNRRTIAGRPAHSEMIVPVVAPCRKNNRISEEFVKLCERGQVAFIPYLTAGDPNLETTVAAAKLLDQCGADIIELGVPYSDPLADGPILQAAATRAISNGTNLDSVFTLMRELTNIEAPIVLFVYYNPLLKRGILRFLEEAAAAGVSGLVVPDLPIEQTGKLRKLASEIGIELVLLTTPTTPRLRMITIAEASLGFIYLVSLTGVTGTRTTLQDRVKDLLMDIKEVSNKPVAVGFGVSTPKQAAQLAAWGADGVIIGSAVVQLLGESGSPEAGLKAVKDFAIRVRAALPAFCPRFPQELRAFQIAGFAGTGILTLPAK